MAHESRATEQAPPEPVAAEAAVATPGGLGPLVFGAFSPAMVISLQRSAGNLAVSRMLAARSQLVQRDPAAPDAVADPAPAALPNGFEWYGTDNSPQLLIERGFVERHGVKHGTTRLYGPDYPTLFRPVVAALLDRYPWTAPRRQEILAALDFSIDISEEAWKQAQMRIPVRHSAFRTIGLPPDAPVQVYIVGGGVEIYADLRGLLPSGGDPGPEVAERILQTLEGNVRLEIPSYRREAIAKSVREHVTGEQGVAVLELDEEWMTTVFGAQAWRGRLDEAGEGTEGGPIYAGRAGTFRLSPRISDEDARFVQETIVKLFGSGRGAKAASEPLDIFSTDVAKLRELAKDKDKLDRLAALLYFGDSAESVKHKSFANLLETAEESLEIQENARRLGVKTPSGERLEPIDRRPVRGKIVNTSGELVPEQEGHFEFQTTDQVDGFRVPEVGIRWVAASKDGSWKKYGSTKYIELRPDGVFNDRIFEQKFPRKGIYEIHAFVNHNFYLPAHFVIPVEVRTEAERLKTADERSGFGRVNRVEPKTFKDVIDEEGGAVDIFTGLFGTAMTQRLTSQERRSEYAQGRRMTGVIDPDVMGVEGGGMAVGLAGLDSEIKEIEQLRAATDKAGGADKADMLGWIDKRLASYKKTRDTLTKAKDEPGTRSVLTQGTYIARTNRARGGPLTLVSWFTRDEDGTYHVNLLDHSQLVRAEDFHFKASGSKYETVMERLFFELTKTYPDGSMTFAFQVFDGTEPTDRFVRFERKTDTVLNDVRDVLYSDEVSTAVNILSILLSVFPPTMALGIAIGFVYNTSQALDTYMEADRTGTLKTEHKVQLALAALSIIPAARGANIVKLGARSFRILSVVEQQANVFLLAESADGEITNLRNSQITDLARLHGDIERLRAQNKSDPQLREMEYRADVLRDEIRNASFTVLEQLAKNQLIQMAPAKAIEHYAAKFSGAKAHPDDVDPARRPHVDDTPAPAAKPGALGDPILSEGLPPSLRREVEVARDENVHDNTVRVQYELDREGLVKSVTIKAGRSATADDVRLHARTAELMLGYRGLSGSARLLLERIKAFLTGSAKPPPVGSRAWEAKLELDKLPRVIEARMKLLEKGTDAATAAKLRAEIEVLNDQLVRHKETFDRLDLEAGTGFVAAEADHHAKAVAAGYPSLDKAEGHYYEPDGKGGYRLRQRADSAAHPMELVEEGGKHVLRESTREQIPGLSLNQNQLRSVLDVMSAGQASALADVFTPAGVERLANAGPRELQAAVHAYERIAPLMDDPVARRGIERVTQSGHMSPEAAVKAINGVPAESLRDLMRVFGDPNWTYHPHAMGPEGIVNFAKKADELRFIARYGLEARNELTRNRDHRKVFGHLLEALHDLDDVAGAELVQKVLAERTPVKREKALDLPARRRHAGLRSRGVAPEYLERSAAWMTEDRQRHLRPVDGTVDVAKAIEAHAKIQQIKDRIEASWEKHQASLSYEAKLRILQEIDDIGRNGGLYPTWISNDRGAVAERLFAPGGGLRQKRIENPLHPAINAKGEPTTGYTRLDGSYAPGTRPHTTLNVKEWVEIKSDEISLPGRNGQPNTQAVATARGYAAAGLQDWHGLQANHSTRGNALVIHFTKKPADAATRKAMLAELFATNSPFEAVGFGDEWENRPAGRALPAMPPEIEDGPIVGVPVAAGP